MKIQKLTKLLIILILFNRSISELTEEEVGEFEYIEAHVNENWDMIFQYYQYNRTEKNYVNIIQTEPLNCNLSRNQVNGNIRFQVNNDQSKIVLEGDEFLKIGKNVIKLPLVNVIKANIFIKPFCLNQRIDLYIYNYDYLKEQDQKIIQITKFNKLIHNFQPTLYQGFKMTNYSINLETGEVTEIQSAAKTQICQSQKNLKFLKDFFLELNIIEANGSIENKIKRLVQKDSKLILPVFLNTIENTYPLCQIYFTDDKLKVLLKYQKNLQSQKSPQEYFLFQYNLIINKQKSVLQVYFINDDNKIDLLDECEAENGLILQEQQQVDVKYSFIRGKDLQYDYTTLSINNENEEINDIQYLSTKRFVDYKKNDFDCKIIVNQQNDENQPEIFLFYKEKVINIDAFGNVLEKDQQKESQEIGYDDFVDQFLDSFQGYVENEIEKKSSKVVNDINNDDEMQSLLQDISFTEEKNKQGIIDYRSQNNIQGILKELENSSDSEQEEIQTPDSNLLSKSDSFEQIQVRKVYQIPLKNNHTKPAQLNSDKRKEIQKLILQQKQNRLQNPQNVIIKKLPDFQNKDIKKDQPKDDLIDRIQIAKQKTFQQYQSKHIPLKIRNQKSNENFKQNVLQKLDLAMFTPNQSNNLVNQIINKVETPRLDQDSISDDNSMFNNFLSDHKTKTINEIQDQISDNQSMNSDNQSMNSDEDNEPVDLDQSIIQKSDKMNTINEDKSYMQLNIMEQMANKSNFSTPVKQRVIEDQQLDPVQRKIVDFLDTNQKEKKKILTIENNELPYFLQNRYTPKAQPLILKKKANFDKIQQVLLKNHIWRLEVQNEQLQFYKQIKGLNVERNIFQCFPYLPKYNNLSNAEILPNINQIKFKWLNDEKYFLRTLEWQVLLRSSFKGIWQEQQSEQNSELLLKFKLLSENQSCVYRLKNNMIEVNFIPQYLVIYQHRVVINQGKLEYKIKNYITQRTIIKSEEQIHLQDSKYPIFDGFVTNRFGKTERQKYHLLEREQFGMQFLTYEKSKFQIHPRTHFCVIDTANYQLNQKIYLRLFQKPLSQNFQYVEVYFKDYLINVFTLHYNKKITYDILTYNFYSKLRRYDLDTLFYIVNTYIEENNITHTQLVSKGFRLRLPYINLKKGEKPKEIFIKQNNLKGNHFLNIYLKNPQLNAVVLRNIFFLTSNNNLMYLAIKDDDNQRTWRTLIKGKHNENIDTIQKQDQIYLCRNILEVGDENYVLQDNPIQLTKGFYMETLFLTDFEQGQRIKIEEATVEMDTFRINIYQYTYWNNLLIQL